MAVRPRWLRYRGVAHLQEKENMMTVECTDYQSERDCALSLKQEAAITTDALYLLAAQLRKDGNMADESQILIQANNFNMRKHILTYILNITDDTEFKHKFDMYHMFLVSQNIMSYQIPAEFRDAALAKHKLSASV